MPLPHQQGSFTPGPATGQGYRSVPSIPTRVLVPTGPDSRAHCGGWTRLESAGGDGGEAGVGGQHVGDGGGAVGLLVVLEQVDERAADRTRGAVQRVDELRALLAADPGPEPSGREVAV